MLAMQMYVNNEYADNSVYAVIDLDQKAAEAMVTLHGALKAAQEIEASIIELQAWSIGPEYRTVLSEDIEEMVEYGGGWVELEDFPEDEDEKFYADVEQTYVSSMGVHFSVYEKHTENKYTTDYISWSTIYKVYLKNHMEDLPRYLNEPNGIGDAAKEILEG